MDISPVGWIVIPVGFLLFLMKREYLFAAVIFTILFFNTSVLYFAPLTFFFKTPFYLLALYLGRLLLDGAVQPSSGLKVYRSSENWWLFAWLLVGTASLLSTMSLSGKVLVHPLEGSLEWQPLQFSFFNVSQLIYWVFFALVFWGFVTTIRSVVDVKRIVRWIIIASLVVLASGLFAQALFSLGYDKFVVDVFHFFGASSIYHRSISGIPRMYSLAGEPGFTGVFLTFAFGLIIIPVITGNDRWLWSRNLNVGAVMLLGLGVILSTGTSGYLALFLLLLAGFLLLPLHTKPARYVSILLKWGGAGAVLTIVVFVLFKRLGDVPVIEFLRETQIEKLLGKYGSVPIRLHFISDALSIAWRYPLLGVGVGGNRAFSVIAALLCNIGFLGTGAFLAFNTVIFRKVFRVFKTTNSAELRSICLSLIITFLGTFGVMAFKSVGSLAFPWYWLLLALMTAVYRIEIKRVHGM